jgi:hypothetical protein
LAFAQDEHYGDIASKYDFKKQDNLIERALEISDAMTPAKPSLWEKSWHHCKMTFSLPTSLWERIFMNLCFNAV